MNSRCLLLILALSVLLLAFARAVPSGTLTEEARIQYMDEGLDEEYDFL